MTNKQTPSEQIAEFLRSHPGDWYIGHGNSRASINLCCDTDLVLIAEDDGIRIIIEHGDQSTDLGGVVTKRTVIVRMTSWLCNRIVNGGGYVEMFPLWLHSAIRDELRRNAINLLRTSGVSYSILEPIVAMYDTPLDADTDPTTSPEISPDSQAIEQVRNRLKATTDLNGEQALGVLEDLRRILGVTV